jgi:hypothetical protein
MSIVAAVIMSECLLRLSLDSPNTSVVYSQCVANHQEVSAFFLADSCERFTRSIAAATHDTDDWIFIDERKSRNASTLLPGEV